MRANLEDFLVSCPSRRRRDAALTRVSRGCSCPWTLRPVRVAINCKEKKHRHRKVWSEQEEKEKEYRSNLLSSFLAFEARGAEDKRRLSVRIVVHLMWVREREREPMVGLCEETAVVPSRRACS
jgi:hypothetical protein